MHIYYVYIYLHPDTGIPFYVGKGKGRRKTHHWRYAKNHKNRELSFMLMQLKECNKIPIIIEVFHTENEIEALDEEERLIRFYGRLDLWTGPLCNLDFYTNGVKWTVERRAKHEAFHKNNPKGWSIDQYSLDGEFIQTFQNTKALTIQFPIIRPIQRCCLDNRRGHGNNGSKIMMHTAYGFRWAYTGDNLIIHDRTTVKHVLQLDKNSGEILNTYKTIKEASITTNTSREGIYDCVNGVAIVAGGYKWKYRDLPAPISPEHKLKRPIIQMDKKYNILNTFESIAEAARSINSNVVSIGKVCRGEMATAAGFKWSYKDEPIPIRNNNSERAVIQMDMDYNIINEFVSIKEASIQTDISAGNISCCCNGGLTAGGYRWWYKDKPIIKRVAGSCRKSIVQMDMDYNIINVFDSLTTASKITGVSMASISRVCSSDLISARGFKWKYVD